MNKAISPIVALAAIGLVIIAAVVMLWKGTQKTVRLPDKPPSGPIPLPPSQQGRILQGGPVSSGAMPAPPAHR
jgi:hypothetical protein